MTDQSLKKPIVIHPFLIALFPALSLVSDNVSLLSINGTVIGIAIITLAIVSLSCLILKSLVRDRQRAGLIITLLILLFVSYGHLFDIAFVLGKSIDIRHRYFFLLWAILSAAAVLFSLRFQGRLANYTYFLNIMSATLVTLSIGQAAGYQIINRNLWQPTILAQQHLGSSVAEGLSPDVYYIILDAYGNTSTLRDLYSFDNSRFLEDLKQRGFYIAEESRSNYSMTTLSLASSLNMEFINSLSDLIGETSHELEFPKQMIENNNVMHFFKSRGYRTVYFGSGYGTTQGNRYADQDITCGSIDETVGRFIQSSLFRAFSDRLHLIENDKRNARLCMFSRLSEMPALEGPKFVFAHIPTPQWPFLFDASGGAIRVEDLHPSEHREAYINQLIFVNKQILHVLDEILLNSSVEPIIILQSDHGPEFAFDGDESWQNPTQANLREKMRILNAFYLPESGSEHFYDEITPVNTFRLIFGIYFDHETPLLDDLSYFSTHDFPYRFRDVTQLVIFDQN